jgi:hypothetical protein
LATGRAHGVRRQLGVRRDCSPFARHAYIVANVSQVLQLGAPEFYQCVRCRTPRRKQPCS